MLPHGGGITLVAQKIGVLFRQDPKISSVGKGEGFANHGYPPGIPLFLYPARGFERPAGRQVQKPPASVGVGEENVCFLSG